MPAIVWLPAKPSPTAAPMAPPPRARPPPTKAPASSMAFWVVATGMGELSYLMEQGRTSSVLRLFDCKLVVEDREQGKDEGLDQPDEHVEQLPRHAEDDAGGKECDREADEQGDHDPARKEVAE